MSKVLIIDDDTTMVSLLRTLLEMDRFEVASVRDWSAIVETARQEQPDLVLMDYFLPRVDALEVLGALRDSPELADTPIVMTSGMDLGEECTAAGAVAFLLKPYTPEQLLHVIETTLRRDGDE